MTDADLKAAVAREVMGISRASPRDYATDIVAAFEVVERMRKQLWFYNATDCPRQPCDRAHYVAFFRFLGATEGYAFGQSLPRAICEAALQAVRSSR